MFKNKVKKSVSRKRPNSENIYGAGSTNSKHVPPKKKVRVAKMYQEDGITKSKKLIQKLQTTGGKSSTRKQRSAVVRIEPRICGNGKPMPPLAELELMFADSDEESKTQSMSIPDVKLTSPTTLEKITNKIINFVTNVPDSVTLIEDDTPPPPVIPPKKRKKPDVPYIVGCKDRPKVPYKPSVSFSKGDDYGIIENSENSDDCLNKRAKRTKGMNFSKSVFNAKSDDIAAWLKDCEKDSDASSDSDKTVTYEYMSFMPRPFSPLPSTSKDNNTILQNDKRFNDSLMQEKINNESENDVEAVELSCETVILDDDLITEQKTIPEVITVDDCDDYAEIVEPTSIENKKLKNIGSTLPIDIDKYNFNLNLSCEDIVETIDVDDVIAENQAIIEKFSQVKNLHSVTQVNLREQNNTDNQTITLNESVTLKKNNSNLINEELHLSSDYNIQSVPKASIVNECHNYTLINKIVKNFFSGKSTYNVINEVNGVRGQNKIDKVLDSFATWLENFNYRNIINKNGTPTISPGHMSECIVNSSLPTTSNTDLVLHLPIQFDNNNISSVNTVNYTNNLQNTVTPLTKFNQVHNTVNASIKNNTSINSINIINTTNIGNIARSDTITSTIMPMNNNTSIQSINHRNTLNVCNMARGATITSTTMPMNNNTSFNSNYRRNTTNIGNISSSYTIASTMMPMNNNNNNTSIHSISRRNITNIGNIAKSDTITSTIMPMNNNTSIQSINHRNTMNVGNIARGDTITSVMQDIGTKRKNIRNRKKQLPISSTFPQLPAQTTVFQANKKSNGIGDCPICMDSLANKSIASTLCGHVFCMTCIKAAIKASSKRCPTCRKNLKGVGYHQLFL
ncbi:putative uncharacterized protein DDB_G0282133 [Achroia grisella]|uniref:putative uncharacterized protein DDB_G0282133 n=1 Tax=Achroia grisella TaxID=688607 RepID=UPI0027D33372|nr:putative uncharacterized protein DDB_G0282133 [Achroia grisella]